MSWRRHRLQWLLGLSGLRTQVRAATYHHAVRVAKLEAVRFPIGDAYPGTVLWVRC